MTWEDIFESLIHQSETYPFRLIVHIESILKASEVLHLIIITPLMAFESIGFFTSPLLLSSLSLILPQDSYFSAFQLYMALLNPYRCFPVFKIFPLLRLIFL